MPGVAPPLATASPTTSTVVVRQSRGDDAAERCALFARIGMDADVVLSVRRDPDFDALYRMQGNDWDSWVVELDGRIEGMGTLLVRDGYVGAQPRRIGYLGDLRFSPRAEGRLLLDRVYGPLLEEARERYGCDLFLTAVIASNARALRALTVRTPRAARRNRPVYTPLMDFDIRSLHLLAPRIGSSARSAAAAGVRVRRAVDADIPALARLLDGDAARRPFGYPMPESELRRRLATWPALRIDSFLVAERGSGELVGTIALWDAAPVKRMRVVEYRRRMRRVRIGYDLAARLLGLPRLPVPGEELRYLYVTHQAVPSDDPRILRALLEAAYAAVRGGGYHFLSICAPAESANDPLAPALRGFIASNLAARLYVVTLPGDPPPAVCFERRPGFEMALV
jgi:hypothetical protein